MPGCVWDGSGFWCPVENSCSTLELADLLELRPELVAQAAVQHLRSMRKATAELEQALSLLFRWTIVDESVQAAASPLNQGRLKFLRSPR